MKKLEKTLLILVLILAALLRLYHLVSNPPSLYWEEAALGYDAYSILKTGKDFHGRSWPIIAFESFGDYKPSGYFYATVPFVAIFGLTPLAVRFPSALFGILTVLLVYLLAKHIFKKPSVSILGAFLLAISPWHLQFSRAGFEANLGLFFVCLGAWLFLKALKQPKYLYLSILSFVLSLYTYHANRVFVPLLGLTLAIIYFKPLRKAKLKTGLALILLVFLSSPLILRLNSPEVKQRFLQTSVFSDLGPLIESNRLIAEDGGGLVARLIHHRFWQYSKTFFDHYLDQFNFDYLFLSGDSNPRHSTQFAGSLYLIQFPLLILGIYYLLKRKKPPWLLFIWLFLAPIPAGLTKATPHALRSLAMVIPLVIISAYGLVQLKPKHLKPLFVIILLLELIRFQYIYHHDYPRMHASHWQYGYQQLIEYIEPIRNNYQHIYVTRELGRPSIYYWFFSQTDPRQVQALDSQVNKDQGEFLEFQNLIFGLPQDNNFDPQSLIIATPKETVNLDKPIHQIKDLNHETVFQIFQN